MDLDTGLLRAFVAVADERHFGRAATHLVVSQQAVSKRIARLESAVGAALLERSSRGVALTELGERLLPQARSILEDLDTALAALRPPRRPVRIDVLDEHLAMLRFVREAVAAGAAGPDVPVEVTMREDHLDAVAALRSGRCEIALGRAGAVALPWPQDIETRTALLEPICLLVGESHPWARRAAVPMAELVGVPVWFPMTGSPVEWRELLDELGEEFGLTFDYAGSTMGFEHFVAQARSGGAVTLYGAAMEPPGPGVRVVPIVDPVPVFAWSAMWRKRLSRESRAVLDAIIVRARAATPEPHPDEAWIPAADRTARAD